MKKIVNKTNDFLLSNEKWNIFIMFMLLVVGMLIGAAYIKYTTENIQTEPVDVVVIQEPQESVECVPSKEQENDMIDANNTILNFM